MSAWKQLRVEPTCLVVILGLQHAARRYIFAKLSSTRERNRRNPRCGIEDSENGALHQSRGRETPIIRAHVSRGEGRVSLGRTSCQGEQEGLRVFWEQGWFRRRIGNG